VPAALITGIVYETDSSKIRIAGLVCSIAVIYTCGITWLCWSTGVGIATGVLIGLVPFIPGDILKVSAAYLIAERLS
jgi:biotin transport system substrate-specific component